MTIRTFGGGFSNHAAGGPSEGLRDTVVVLRVVFKDPKTDAPVAVTDPVARFTRNGVAQAVEALDTVAGPGIAYPLIADGDVGYYKISFLTTGLATGLYLVDFEGAWTDPDDSTVHTLRVSGDVGLGAVSRTQDLIRRVKSALMDDIDPRLYRLDAKIPQWSDERIFTYLRDAVDRINDFPPRLTGYTLETLPNDHMAILGAQVYALRARARYEKSVELDYSDVHTLNIKRADFYKQLADSLYQEWEAEIVAYKRMTPPTPIGLKGQQLPFRISRVLGLLPNFRTLFSG